MTGSVTLKVHPQVEDASWIVPSWEALISSNPKASFFDTPTWVLNYWRYRRGTGEKATLLLGKVEDRLVGLVPLSTGANGIERILPTWEAVHSSGEYESNWICHPGHARPFLQSVCNYLERHGRKWYQLRINSFRDNASAVAALRQRCVERGRACDLALAKEVPFVNTNGIDSSADLLDGKYRRELARRARKLACLGPVSITDYTDQDNLREPFEAFVDVEASGWKGEAGTAIKHEPHAKRFWWEVSLEAAGRGMLRLHLLKVGSQVIAGQLGVVFNRCYYCLKLGYDESFKTYSPGALVTQHAIDSALHDSGVDVYDFAGARQPYMDNWTKQTYQLWLLTVGSPAIGRGGVFQVVHSTRSALRPVRRAFRSWRTNNTV